jgi:hypothetical protein
MNWYYEFGGQRQGPISKEEIDRLVVAGTISLNTLVWKEGMETWAALKDVEGSGVGEGIRCSATGRIFPAEEIVYIAGKPYSLEAKERVMQSIAQTGELPSEDEEERTGPEWEDRDRWGFFPAGWQTTKSVMMDPTRTFSKMKREGGLGGPFLYSFLLSLCGLACSIFYQFIVMGVMKQSSGELSKVFGESAGGAGLGLGFVFLIGIIAVPAGIFMMSGITHLSLKICGGATQPFETTFRTYCYASGPGAALQLIPICGGSIGAMWTLVCFCIGLAKTHQISTTRAVCAVLLPGVTCVFLMLLAILAGAGFSQMGGR